LLEDRVAGSPKLREGLAAGGAPVMWERAVRSLLPSMKRLVPRGSEVLEVGYGDGLLSCYLHQNLGWRILGVDVSSEACHTARNNATRFGLDTDLEFRCCPAEKVWSTEGHFDAVFIKTVLYNSTSLEEYETWLDWIFSVLKPDGIFVNFDTGRANSLTQFYRQMRGRSYTKLCLYTSKIESLFDDRFEIIDRRYFGGISQFFAPLSLLYFIASRVEEKLRKRHADNSFIVAMICRRPSGANASILKKERLSQNADR
jgi:ubiquinone/menaquinone biosynthesis C-methylase UbiE